MRAKTFGAHDQLKKYTVPLYESQTALKCDKIRSEAADRIPSGDPNPNCREEEFCGTK